MEINDVTVFGFVEALPTVLTSAVTAFFTPEMFLKYFTKATIVDEVYSHQTIFVTRLFGLTAMGFGGMLHLTYRKSTSVKLRKDLLKVLIVGDAMHLTAVLLNPDFERPSPLFFTHFLASSSLFLYRFLLITDVLKFA